MLVFPSELLTLTDGLSRDQRMLDSVLWAQGDALNREFRPRSEVETDESVKQIIPYVIVYHPGTNCVLTYARGTAGGEDRLHAQRSIGIGGHISLEDARHSNNVIGTAATREITEEIGIQPNYVPRPIALVYDSATEVGRVHLGVVIVVKMHSWASKSTCPSLVDMRYVPVDELAKESGAYERWSRFCIDNLDWLLTRKSVEEVIEASAVPHGRKGSVLQNWVNDLSLMQQTVLITTIRGPDGLRKFHPSKILCRWLRRSILLSAFDRRPLLTPYEPGGGSFIGPCHDQDIHNIEDAVNVYFRHIDEVPLHFHLHLMHASEILGYKHPVPAIQDFWQSFYFKMAKDLHLTPETEEQLDKRLGDREEDWRASETISAS